MDQLVASPIEWAYLSGIIDGEGCVYAVESKSGRSIKRPSISPNFRIHLTVTNTSEHLIGWITGRFKGYVCVTHKVGQHKATRTCWRVEWRGEKAEIVLRGCLPYLTVKKYQAELAFKLREMVGSYSLKGKSISGRHAKIPDEVISERRAVVEAMKAAKKTQ